MTAASTEGKVLYVDSSALVKLVISEAESEALAEHVSDDAVLATSRIAIVEVPRAASVANPSAEARTEAQRVVESCLLVDVTDRLLRRAARHTSATVRTLDAIHLASAEHVEPDEMIVYDRRLREAAVHIGLPVAHPGT